VPAGSAVSDKNPAENQKIESEKPVLPGIPGQVPQNAEPFGANADRNANRKMQEKQ
jgi:hypothetical protein